MKTYISGKITGLEISEAKRLFDEAEARLRLEGKTPVNPMTLVPYHPELTWIDYMVEDIRGLLDCQAIYMLRNWKSSRGARIERAIAQEMGLEIFYESAS